MDGGPLAAQDYCLVEPGSTPESLWREQLFPMGLRLFRQVLGDLARGRLVSVPQDERLATWEPSWERPPVRRPDLTLIGTSAASRFDVRREACALRA